MISLATRKREGFTLIEMVVVIAILGLLMAAAVPAYFQIQAWAERNSAKRNIQTFKAAITTYKLTVGSFPDKLEDLLEKPSDPSKAKKWPGKLLDMDTIPHDPWDQEYHYQKTPGGTHGFELYSDGDPGAPAQISAWD